MGQKATNQFTIKTKGRGQTSSNGEVKNIKIAGYGIEGKVRISFLYKYNLSTFDAGQTGQSPSVIISLSESSDGSSSSNQASMYLTSTSHQVQSVEEWTKFETVYKIVDDVDGVRLKPGKNTYYAQILLVASSDIMINAYGIFYSEWLPFELTYNPKIVTSWDLSRLKRTGNRSMDVQAFDGTERFYFKVGFDSDATYTNLWRGNIKFKPRFSVVYTNEDGDNIVYEFKKWTYAQLKNPSGYTPFQYVDDEYMYIVNLPIGQCDNINFSAEAFFTLSNMLSWFNPNDDASFPHVQDDTTEDTDVVCSFKLTTSIV